MSKWDSDNYTDWLGIDLPYDKRVCPYCGHEENAEPFEDFSREDGGESEQECNWCNEKYVVVTSYSTEYTAFKKGDS